MDIVQIESNKTRIDWIDMAKGWATILVILGHLWLTPPWLNMWLYSFHMPLFFLLSGVTYNRKKYVSLKALIKEKSKALLIPYIILSVVMLTWNASVEIFRVITENRAFDYAMIYNAVIGLFMNIRTTKYGGLLWFIPCIFTTFILLYLILKVSKHSVKTAFLISLLILVAGYVYATFVDLKLPWGIDAAFVSVFFMLCGFLLHNNLTDSKWLSYNNISLICGGGVLLMINIITAYFNRVISGKQVDMYSNEYGNLILFLLSSFSGIVFIVIISNFVSLRFIKFVGRNSLYFYGVHRIAIGILAKMSSYLPEMPHSLMKYMQYPIIIFAIAFVIAFSSIGIKPYKFLIKQIQSYLCKSSELGK